MVPLETFRPDTGSVSWQRPMRRCTTHKRQTVGIMMRHRLGRLEGEVDRGALEEVEEEVVTETETIHSEPQPTARSTVQLLPRPFLHG